uniref:F-box domain-containing protein n=1 Tax=Aegilops tauschii subsp. strangulata TaxID=200361 RepID=A0A453T0H5_AEGTS
QLSSAHSPSHHTHFRASSLPLSNSPLTMNLLPHHHLSLPSGPGRRPSPAAAEVEMDPRVWRRLPQPLLDRVLACLPTPSFLRARAVCR